MMTMNIGIVVVLLFTNSIPQQNDDHEYWHCRQESDGHVGLLQDTERKRSQSDVSHDILNADRTELESTETTRER